MITVQPEDQIRGTLLIDFDSTLVSVEALDELAKIVLDDHEDRDKLIRRIEGLTKAGMEGVITMGESLQARLSLLKFGHEHIDRLVEVLRRKVTTSFLASGATVAGNADRIHVVSGGFLEWVVPVCTELGIYPDHCHANRFQFDELGRFAGIDQRSTLATHGGKPRTIAALRVTRRLQEPVVLVGDGATDLEALKARAVDHFIAYTEHANRERIVAEASEAAASFDEVFAAWKRCKPPHY